MTHSKQVTDQAMPQMPSRLVIYRVVLAVLVVAIFATALAIVQQTQERHQIHIQIRKLDMQLDDLQVEEQRLMIEQQTFSATPQVASRAVSELGMFFPSAQSRRVVAPGVAKPSNTQGESQ